MAPNNQIPDNRQPELDLLLPRDTLEVPLWKSLFASIDAALFPKKLPPLVLTSKPVEQGELWGERLTRPWWQSVFSNLRDVLDRKSTRLNSSHLVISYAVFCLKKKI